jgi:hypothetical protein
MTLRPTALERAFDLAKTGRYATLGEIKQALHHEGYSTASLTGPLLMKQIRQLIAASRSSANAE